MLLLKPLLTSLRGRKNYANAPSSEFKHIKISMINKKVENSEAKAEIMNKNKNNLRKLVSKFKDTCPSAKRRFQCFYLEYARCGCC